MKHILLPFLLAVFGAAISASGAATGVVTATRLNVRARPGIQYEVVCQVKQGTSFDIVRQRGEWYGVRAPKSATAWIAASALTDNRITASSAPVYAGASTVFSTFGQFQRGDTTQVLRVKDGKWALVEPPENAVVWVHGDFIKVETPEPPPKPETTTPEPPEQDPTATAKPPAATGGHQDPAATAKPDGGEPPAGDPADTTKTPAVVPSSKKPEPAVDQPPEVAGAFEPEPGTFRIHRIAPNPERDPNTKLGKPRDVQRQGIIIPLGDADSPWSWALAVRVHDTYYPLAYLETKDDLEKQKWRDVVVSGKQHWIKGWPRPLIKIESVQPGAVETP